MVEQDPATVRANPDPDQVKLGQAFRVGAEGDEAVKLMVTLLDRQDAALPIRRLRDWGLGLAKVQFGETVVDVGSGTGTLLREFGTLVGPGGRAVGVEPNPRLRAVATERAAASANISVIDGLAGTLPFDDESVDLVWCERVLQHLTDPQGAFAEFARVLRPGDERSSSTPTTPARVDLRHRPRGRGQDPGRLHPGHAERSSGPAHPASGDGGRIHRRPRHRLAALLLPTVPEGGPSLLEVGARHAVTLGLISQEEADEVARAHRARPGGLRLRGGHRLRVPAAEARLTRSEC